MYITMKVSTTTKIKTNLPLSTTGVGRYSEAARYCARFKTERREVRGGGLPPSVIKVINAIRSTSGHSIKQKKL